MKHKKLLIVLSSLLALLLTAGAVFAAAILLPKKEDGRYYRAIIDRVNIEVSPTDFVFERPQSDDGTLLVSFTLSLEKTEGDFYARLLDADVEGLDYTSLEILDGTGAGLTKDGVFLPVNEDGSPKTLTLTFNARFLPPETDLSPTLTLHLISGLSEDTADERYLEIPLSIRFD